MKKMLKNQKFINDEKNHLYKSCDSVTLEATKNIIHQMENCVCKINYEGNIESGFFCKIPLDKNNKCNTLITSSNLFKKENKDKDKVKNKNKIIKIYFNDENDYKIINIDKNRKIYCNLNLGIQIIILEEKDNINNKKLFLELDDNLLKENYFYKDSSIYIIQYKNGNEISVSYGKINKISEGTIYHYCKVENNILSGAPILNLSNNKVIGMQTNIKKSGNNSGSFLKLPINEFLKMKDKDIKEDYSLKIESPSNFFIKNISQKNDNNQPNNFLSLNQMNNIKNFNNINFGMINQNIPNVINMNANINIGMNPFNNIENEENNNFPFKEKYINDLCKEDGPKLNIIIEIENNKKGINIKVNHGKTVHQVLITFLKIIGKPDLEGSQYIKFIYNNNYLDINDQNKVENIFHNASRIYYIEPQGLVSEIIFKTTLGANKRIFINGYCTVCELLKEYLDEIGKAELFGKKDKLKFIYKGENIDFEEKEKVIKFFKADEENIITVADLEKNINN